MGPIRRAQVPSGRPIRTAAPTQAHIKILAGPLRSGGHHRPSQTWAAKFQPLYRNQTMTIETAPQGATQIINYKTTPVRILMLDGSPWFASEDIADALGLHHWAIDRQIPKLPAHAVRECQEDTEEGLTDAKLLSPIGVWLITHLIDPRRGAGVAAWARRTAADLVPNPTPKDPRLFLTPAANGAIPPRPDKYSGRLSEWRDLKDELAGVKTIPWEEHVARQRAFIARRAEA